MTLSVLDSMIPSGFDPLMTLSVLGLPIRFDFASTTLSDPDFLALSDPDLPSLRLVFQR